MQTEAPKLAPLTEADVVRHNELGQRITSDIAALAAMEDEIAALRTMVNDKRRNLDRLYQERHDLRHRAQMNKQHDLIDDGFKAKLYPAPPKPPESASVAPVTQVKPGEGGEAA
jgi:hypothetical protein